MSKQSRKHKGGEQERTSTAAAEKAFVESLIVTGQASRPDANGKLPAGATHEIVESEAGDSPKVVRRRFSIY